MISMSGFERGISISYTISSNEPRGRHFHALSVPRGTLLLTFKIPKDCIFVFVFVAAASVDFPCQCQTLGPTISGKDLYLLWGSQKSLVKVRIQL